MLKVATVRGAIGIGGGDIRIVYTEKLTRSFESRHRLFLIARYGVVGLLSAGATYDEIAPSDRSLVWVKVEYYDCQPDRGLSAKSCASFQLLPQ
jgi:hypothetical protein